MNSGHNTLMNCINSIDLEDLQYVETDLSFYQLVSVGFLLYGDTRTGSEFILQSLIILAQHPPQGKGLKEMQHPATSDVLRNYTKLNTLTWRQHIVEALAIIKAKNVLRKLGLKWQQIRDQFLPHIAEISVHIHPLLKVLYEISERLKPYHAGKLINFINNKHSHCQRLRFYDSSYLEIFFLNWLARDIIVLGTKTLENSNMQILIEYFKFNDMLELRDLLIATINQNIKNDKGEVDNKATQTNGNCNNLRDSGVVISQELSSICSNTEEQVKQKEVELAAQVVRQQVHRDFADRYKLSKENAGYVLIINQSDFYNETDPKYRYLVPFMNEFIPKRQGTNVDRDKLAELFSSFGYYPLVFENLTHLEMLHQIRETVKKSLLKDSLVICLLSHGMEGVVFGCNTVPVAIAEIREILTADTLNGKPKLLIIQACQRNVCGVDTKSSTSITDFSPDAYADILLAMSSMPGTDALRHTEYGSWFVDSLYKLTQQYGDNKHMLDILTAVIRDISKRRGDANQVMLPLTSSTLRKEFYLPSRKV